MTLLDGQRLFGLFLDIDAELLFQRILGAENQLAGLFRGGLRLFNGL